MRYIITVFVLVSTLLASIINVPEDQSTIQSGIDTASPGDTVLVAPGTYLENVNFNGKNILLTSHYLFDADTNFIHLTIIDANQTGSGVIFLNGEEPDARIQGFTVTNGTGTLWDGQSDFYMGGGIVCKDSNPTMTNLIISSNWANRGGGIYIRDCTPILDHLRIINNTVGGGNNDEGAGMYFWGANPTCTNLEIVSNHSTDDDGGGMALNRSSAPTFENILIKNNTCVSRGGGIFAWDYGNASFKNVQIIGNQAGNLGGAAHLDANCSPTFEDALIIGNQALGSGTGGGAFYLYDNANPVFINATFYGNTTPAQGGALRVLSDSEPTLVNTIIWENSPHQISLDNSSGINIAYSDIEGGIEEIGSNDLENILIYDNNMDEDPLFENPDFGEFSLQGGSPCIDAGTAFYSINGNVIIDLAPEEYGGSAPDMGAVESFDLVSDFIADITLGEPPLTVQFTDLSVSYNDNDIFSWDWDFNGDGVIDSNLQNPEWMYTELGDYSVTLTISDGSETAQRTRGNYIHVAYNPDIQVSPETVTIELLAGEGDDSNLLNIQNTGAGQLDYSISQVNTGDGIEWLLIAGSTGSLQPDSNTDIVLSFTAENLVAGEYQQQILVASNDPDSPGIMVPVTMTVVGAPNISVVPDALNFGDVYLNLSHSLSIQIDNTGTELLSITDMYSNVPEFSLPNSPFSIDPGAAVSVEITFTPTTAELYSGMLTIESNDPENSMVEIFLTGAGIDLPNLQTPANLVATGGPGQIELYWDPMIVETSRTDMNIWISDVTPDYVDVSCSLDADLYGLQFLIVADALFNPIYTGISSGLAEEYFSLLTFNPGGMALGYSLSGDFIPAGSEGLLLRMSWEPEQFLNACVDLDVVAFPGGSGTALTYTVGEAYCVGESIITYSLYRDNELLVQNLATNYYIDAGLPSNVTYCYYVKGHFEGFTSDPTEPDCATTGVYEGCLDPDAWNYNPAAIVGDDSCIFMPEGFAFSQSTLQAFYMIENALVGVDQLVTNEDWIGIFNGDNCVGAYPWVGPFTTVPAMGYDGNPWTEGYLESGMAPTFQFFDGSEGQYYSAIVDGNDALQWENFGYYQIPLLSVDIDCAGVPGGSAYLDDCGWCDANPGNDNDSCSGCMDPLAANYDEGCYELDGFTPAPCTMDDGFCIYESVQMINLHEGANLISFNLIPDDQSVAGVLQELAGIVNGVIGEGVAAIPNPSNPNLWLGSLQVFSPESGYWLLMEEDAVLTVSGLSVNQNINYSLHGGANLISYPYASSSAREDAISEEFMPFMLGIIGEGVVAIPNPAFPDQWIGSLTTFEGGHGYWMIISQDLEFQWNIPNDSGLLLSQIQPVTGVPEFSQSSEQAFYFVSEITGIENFDENHVWLEAYNGSTKVGTNRWDGPYTDVPAMGQNGSPRTNGYCTPGSNVRIMIFDEFTGLRYHLDGDVSPWQSNQITVTGSLNLVYTTPDEYLLVNTYPNPFNPSVNIAFFVQEAADVEVSVVDLRGQIIDVIYDAHCPIGNINLTWNAANQSTGVYIITVKTSNSITRKKVMLLK